MEFYTLTHREYNESTASFDDKTVLETEDKNRLDQYVSKLGDYMHEFYITIWSDNPNTNYMADILEQINCEEYA